MQCASAFPIRAGQEFHDDEDRGSEQRIFRGTQAPRLIVADAAKGASGQQVLRRGVADARKPCEVAIVADDFAAMFDGERVQVPPVPTAVMRPAITSPWRAVGPTRTSRG